MKKRFRFQLKSFLLFVLMLSTLAGYVGQKQSEYLRERSAIDQIRTASTSSRSRFEIFWKSDYDPDKMVLF